MRKKNHNAFIKKQKAEKKRKKNEEKKQKKEAKKDQETSRKMEDMIAYVDKYGNITSEPPDEKDRRNQSLRNKKK